MKTLQPCKKDLLHRLCIGVNKNNGNNTSNMQSIKPFLFHWHILFFNFNQCQIEELTDYMYYLCKINKNSWSQYLKNINQYYLIFLFWAFIIVKIFRLRNITSNITLSREIRQYSKHINVIKQFTHIRFVYPSL